MPRLIEFKLIQKDTENAAEDSDFLGGLWIGLSSNTGLQTLGIHVRLVRNSSFPEILKKKKNCQLRVSTEMLEALETNETLTNLNLEVRHFLQLVECSH